MVLRYYKNYRICDKCRIAYPLTREYFKRNTICSEDKFHHKCRSCEIEELMQTEWQDGKLLCHKCKVFKPEDCFSKNGSSCKSRNNRRYICKECFKTKQQNLDIALDNDKKLKKCLRFRLLGARDRSKKHDIAFNLDLDFLMQLWEKQKGRCALSGVQMTFELKKGRVATNVSIDRIDSKEGYIKSNIQLVCMACNQIKSDLELENMYKFCKAIVENYESKNSINPE